MLLQPPRADPLDLFDLPRPAGARPLPRRRQRRHRWQRVSDATGAPMAGLWVQAAGQDGSSRGASTTAQGRFGLSDLPFGDYTVTVAAEGSAPFSRAVSVGSDTVAKLDVKLEPLSATADAGELNVTVRADRIRINRSAAVSSQEEDQKQIEALPGGSTQSLPKVLYSTNPGFVEGSFGQVFSRGNHANLQYDIDGIQLPDSVSGTFGDAFSLLNIDRMEVITGGSRLNMATVFPGW